MIYIIAEPCIGVCDTACVDVCPVDCIHGPAPLDDIRDVRGDGGEAGEAALKKAFGDDIQLYIDPEECISCGACEPECPVEAIFEDEEVPDKWIPYTKLNADFFENR